MHNTTKYLVKQEYPRNRGFYILDENEVKPVIAALEAIHYSDKYHRHIEIPYFGHDECGFSVGEQIDKNDIPKCIIMTELTDEVADIMIDQIGYGYGRTQIIDRFIDGYWWWSHDDEDEEIEEDEEEDDEDDYDPYDEYLDDKYYI